MAINDRFSRLAASWLNSILAFSGRTRKKRPGEVFTPRSATVTDMYVERLELERALRSGLESGFHLVIRGASGHGKSWLYKKVLGDLGAYYLVGNLANASRFGSISAALGDLVRKPVRTSYRVGKEAGAEAFGASGKVSTDNSYEIRKEDPFEVVLQECRKRAGTAPAVLVLDNLEAIVDKPELLRELADLIIPLDDERYARHKVKLLLVGAVDELQRYYTEVPQLTTVWNRLREVLEVPSFSAGQCRELIERGLIAELGLQVAGGDLLRVINHIALVTQRVPQYVHEYCLELAQLAVEKELPITRSLLPAADALWREQPLVSTEKLPETSEWEEARLEEAPRAAPPEPMESPPSADTLSEPRGLRERFGESLFVRYMWKAALWLLLVAFAFYLLICLYFGFIF